MDGDNSKDTAKFFEKENKTNKKHDECGGEQGYNENGAAILRMNKVVVTHLFVTPLENVSDVPSTSVALVLTVGHNAKKRKTSHFNWKGKAAKGKSKVEYEIAPTSERAHDKEGTRADVSAPDWSAPEGTKILPANQSENDTSAYVSPYHYGVEQHDQQGGNQFANDDYGVEQHDQQGGNQFANDDVSLILCLNLSIQHF
ncbi:hypothetical protein Tco_1140159 [Tanacetum coccineum]